MENETLILDDAGAYKQLKTKVEDLFRFGRHKTFQVIYSAQYAKEVLPVREKSTKIYITKNNLDNLFDSIVNTCSKKDITRWKQNRDQMDFGIINYDTRTQKLLILNHKYQIVYDSKNKNKQSPEEYVRCKLLFHW